MDFMNKQSTPREENMGLDTGEGKRILVVDDDRDLVASIEAFLKARGFEVATASNGKEAYARVLEARPDLIVLDVMMDYDEEGMVFASALKTDGPTLGIPIVMLSGFNVQEDVREKVLASLMGQDFPAEVFMQKPVRLAELAERIHTLLENAGADRKPWPV